ncbi:hypothetical protein RJ640_013438 [Escallonia rubra]|uniref:TF-B3 domain-containing protein n=1 Tax=Escallonia rubra TaxID=112253 RepID=A0AA88UBH5_9ASTE|nr:hypothetical protein RJ640_013438 [Escallonia rubra]
MDAHPVQASSSIFSPVKFGNLERIPFGFLKHMSDETSGSVSLMGSSGNTWEVNLMKNNESLFFNKGWSSFVKDHFAELWDFIVFKYDGNSHFTVKVFDKSGCEKETAFLAKCSQDALKLYLTIAQSTNSASIPFCWTSGSMSGPVKRSQAQNNRGVNLNAVKINQLLKKKAKALSIAIAKWEDGFHFRKVGSESAYTQVSAMNFRSIGLLIAAEDTGPVKRSQAQQNRGVNLSAVKINQLLRKKARALFIAIAKCEDGCNHGELAQASVTLLGIEA